MATREQILRTKLNIRETIKRAAVQKWAESALPKYATICGSYRRNKPVLHDIDIMVPAEHYDDLLARLIVLVYMRGPMRCSGFIRVGRVYVQADICAYAPESYACMLLYFTGSREFNIKMRAVAKKKGFCLNQTGLYKLSAPEKPLKVPDELTIFKKLKQPYVRAENRG
jgi:DNA polymerase (family 10)